jgi:hypothetical protein
MAALMAKVETTRRALGQKFNAIERFVLDGPRLPVSA